MNLTKAIEILDNQYKRHKVGGDTGYRDAIKLGIEALKCILNYRFRYILSEHNLLPGETED